MATGSFNLAFLRTTELTILQIIAFRLGHKIYVLDTSFPESYSLVGIVLAHWGVDVETVWQLGIDCYLITRFQLISEVHLNAF